MTKVWWSVSKIWSPQRIERNKRMRLLDYARSDRKDGKAVLDFFTRMRFLHVSRNDIACVKLLIVGDMEL